MTSMQAPEALNTQERTAENLMFCLRARLQSCRNSHSIDGALAPEVPFSDDQKGFTLIELLIVMSLILILMTLAVPQMLKLTKQAHETSAIQSLRTIVQGQLQYNSQYPANGFSCTLAQLGGDPKSGAPSAQAAQLIEPALASGNKAGYTFNLTNCTKVTVNNQDMFTGYEVTAVPNSVGKSGDRGFCADENNKITFDPAGGTNCTQPIQ